MSFTGGPPNTASNVPVREAVNEGLGCGGIRTFIADYKDTDSSSRETQTGNHLVARSQCIAEATCPYSGDPVTGIPRGTAPSLLNKRNDLLPVARPIGVSGRTAIRFLPGRSAVRIAYAKRLSEIGPN